MNVVANVPFVALDKSTSGTHTILKITVTHLSPTSIHYINAVQVTVTNSSGTQTYSPQPPAPTQKATFVVTYDLGVVNTNTIVSVIAHCVVHGNSPAATLTLGPPGNRNETPTDNTMIYIAIMVIIVIVAAIVGLLILRRKKAPGK